MHESQDTRLKGRYAEELAAEFLKTRGVEIVDRNVSSAGAEIDIVARLSPWSLTDPTEFVFVEVRSRSDRSLGHPLETINRRKQQRIIRAATSWLISHELWEKVAVRFDVVGIVPDEHDQSSYVDPSIDGTDLIKVSSSAYILNGQQVRLVWIQDAFSLS